MAVFRPILGELNASLGSTTWTHNKGGPVAKRRALPTNRTSVRQLGARQNIAQLSREWALLTDNQRADWTRYAEQHPNPNALGDPHTGSGLQAYQTLNRRRQTIGLSPPNVTPPTTAAPPPLRILTVTALSGLRYRITFSPSPIPLLTYLVIFTSAPHSAGRTPTFDRAFLQRVIQPGNTTPQTFTITAHRAQATQTVTLFLATYLADGRAYPPTPHPIVMLA